MDFTVTQESEKGSQLAFNAVLGRGFPEGA